MDPSIAIPEAADGTARRRVATKVIRDSMLHDHERVRRCEREAEVLARLQHPGVAQVYAAGVADDPQGAQPCFASSACSVSRWASTRRSWICGRRRPRRRR